MLHVGENVVCAETFDTNLGTTAEEFMEAPHP